MKWFAFWKYFSSPKLGLVCDINALSRLVPSLFLSLTLSPCPPTPWIKCPIHYLCPITNIHLNIASNSIQCIQHLRMSTSRPSGGPAQVFIGALAFKTICWKREISKYVEWSLPWSYRPYLHLYIHTQAVITWLQKPLRGCSHLTYSLIFLVVESQENIVKIYFLKVTTAVDQNIIILLNYNMFDIWFVTNPTTA